MNEITITTEEYRSLLQVKIRSEITKEFDEKLHEVSAEYMNNITAMQNELSEANESKDFWYKAYCELKEKLKTHESDEHNKED